MLDMFNEPILVLNLSLIIFPNSKLQKNNPFNIPTIVWIINL